MIRPIEQAIRHLKTNIRDIHAWERAHEIASKYNKAIIVQWRSGPFTRQRHIVTDVYVYPNLSRIGFVSTDGGSVGLDLSSVVQYGILNMDITDKPPPERPIFPMSESAREHTIVKLRELLLEADEKAQSLRHRALTTGDPQDWDRYEDHLVRTGDIPSALASKAKRIDPSDLRALSSLLTSLGNDYDLVLHAYDKRLPFADGKRYASFIITKIAPHTNRWEKENWGYIKGHRFYGTRRGAEGGQPARRLLSRELWVDYIVDVFGNTLGSEKIRFYILPKLLHSIHTVDWV